MNSQEAAVSPCQERDFREMGPGACEGGGGREILNAAPLGVNAVAPPRWPMGKKTRRALCPKRSPSQLSQDASMTTLCGTNPASLIPVDGPAHTRDPRLPHSLGQALFASSLGTSVPVQELWANDFYG